MDTAANVHSTMAAPMPPVSTRQTAPGVTHESEKASWIC
jgi:hypothetical protein